jgi:Cupin domain
MQASQRPETLLGNGIRWLELAGPGHSMAPAVLLAAPGADSGGFVTLARENFITVVEGVLEFRLPEAGDWLRLEPGDGLVLAPGQTHSWRNPSQHTTARALWVEQLATRAAAPAGCASAHSPHRR